MHTQKNIYTRQECPSDAYLMQKVEEFIDRSCGAKFITMLDLAPLDRTLFVNLHYDGKFKVKVWKTSLVKFYSSWPAVNTQYLCSIYSMI